MAAHNDLGKRGEDIAAQFLEKIGYTIFERNYAFEKGEIDIVAYQPTEIVFVEVKTRSGFGAHFPEEAVDDKKKKLLFRTADSYLYERKLQTVPARFDILSIQIEEGKEPDIQHFKDAFRYVSSL